VLYIFVMHSINILIFSLYKYFPKRSNIENYFGFVKGILGGF